MVRDAKGKFVKGHPCINGGKGGRPPRSDEDKFLERLKASVSDNDWDTIVGVAVSRAKAGDPKARAWLGNYLMGLPRQPIDIEGEIWTFDGWLTSLEKRARGSDKTPGKH
jgi:hypothetical protein